MTEEKTISTEQEDTDSDNSILTEDELRRQLEDMNGNTKQLKVADIQTASFQCTRNGTDRYSVTLYNPSLTIDVNIRDILPDEKAVEFVEQYDEGQEVYATFVNIQLGDSTYTYLGEISTNKQDAEKVYEKFRNHERNKMPFSIRDYGDKLIYGTESSIRSYLPDFLDNKDFRVSKSNDTIIGIFSILGIIYLLGNLFPLFYLIPILFVILLVPLGYYVAKGTGDIYKTEINPELIRTEPHRDITVLECEYYEDDEKLVIESTEKDARWVFEKNENGKLSNRGQRAYDRMRKIGSSNRAMIPVSEPQFADVDNIPSEDENYTILT